MKLKLLILLSIIIDLSFGQAKYDANWCFGVKAGINFNDTANPTNFNTLCDAAYTTACISDSLGNLLFYIAPDTPFNMGSTEYIMNAIYDNTNNIILNGDSINVGIGYIDGLTLPVHGRNDSYCLFYEAWIDSFNDVSENDCNFGNLIYSEVSNSSNGYAVTNKNQVLSNIPTEFRLAAIKHANGNDWWLLLHQSEEGVDADSTNIFIEYLIIGDSIFGPYTQSIGGFHNSYLSNWGQIVFSKDGNWLACSLGDDNAVDVFNFDRCTGQLKNHISLLNIDTAGKGQMVGCAFSANSTKLYISEGFHDIDSVSALYQYSLTTPEIPTSKAIIWYGTKRTITFGGINLAADNRIYVSVAYKNTAPYGYNEYNQYNQYLWVVESPDSAGLACNFQPYGYYLGDSARVYWGLVNMPNYNLGPLSIYQAGAGSNTVICSPDTSAIMIGLPPVPGVIYSWQAADGITDTTQAQQLVQPQQSTWYYVTITDTTIQYSCQSRLDSVYVEVEDCVYGVQNVLTHTEYLTMFPNPAKDIVYIITSLAVNENGTLQFADIDGQKIDELTVKGGLNSYTLSTTNFADGVYLYHLRTDQQYDAHGKLVVTH